jgi:hypothetical protein
VTPTTCRIAWCTRERVRDALYCRDHLRDAWLNRLPDPNQQPAWVRRLALNAKELSSGRPA